MSKFLSAFLLLLLSACGNSQQWQHFGKSKHDFAIDDYECKYLAQSKIKEMSLSSQPLSSGYNQLHSNCLQARGWRPVKTVDYTPQPVNIEVDDDKTEFLTGRLRLSLDGPYRLIQQQKSEFLLEQEDLYIYLLFQLDYPQKLVQKPPPLDSKATYFDSYQRKDLIARFYYQEVEGKLVFACISHLYVNDNSRIVVSLSKEFFTMPSDFLSLPADQFNQLLTCQKKWEKLLDHLAHQL